LTQPKFAVYKPVKFDGKWRQLRNLEAGLLDAQVIRAGR
jgi:hypothetical protein